MSSRRLHRRSLFPSSRRMMCGKNTFCRTTTRSRRKEFNYDPNFMIQTLEWTDQGVRFIDQTKLPTEEVYVLCKTHEQVADVIRDMVVRGAPAIGVAAAMGIALGVKNSTAATVGELKT